jgi:hypothetical protein
MTVAPDATAEGLTCAACGYELRGLPPDSACPECGTSIEDTVGAAPVVRWLGGFRLGVTAFGLALFLLPFVVDALTGGLRWFGRRINPDGRVLLAQALLLLPAAWWLTRPATFLPRDPARLRPWVMGLTAAQGLLAVIEIVCLLSLSFPAGVLLLSAYALGPFPLVAEMALLFTLLTHGLFAVPGTPPRWLGRVVQGSVVYVLLSPALMMAVVNFARIRLIRAPPRSYTTFLPGEWDALLNRVVARPAYAVQPFVWLGAVAFLAFCTLRLWREGALPRRAVSPLPATDNAIR